MVIAGRMLARFGRSSGLVYLGSPVPTLALLLGPLYVALDLTLGNVWWLPQVRVRWPKWGIGWLLVLVTWGGPLPD